MSDAIITVSGLGKKYRISHQADRPRYTALRDVIANKVKGLLSSRKAKAGHGKSVEDFWALKDVSFEIKRGEVVGVIGRNGAGKSTLLKVLSRITEPTQGRVHLKGRVSSLLEVGTGFHPELTGRENIFLNGAILGMSRVEIRRKFDEIVAFAEVEKFLDTPVKRYSSGMYVRLAFAVAAHLEPEILIVDEVLAVGDAEFQKKCLGKMGDVAKGGRTVLFVSHNMAAITKLCQTGLLLNRGRVEAHGKAEAVVTDYLNVGANDSLAYVPDPAKKPVGNDSVHLLSVALRGVDGSTGPNFGSGTAIKVEITYRVLKPARGFMTGIDLLSSDGTIVFNSKDTDPNQGVESKQPQQTGVFQSSCFIPPGLLNRGQYSVSVGCATPMQLNFYCENVVFFFIVPTEGGDVKGDRPGLICPNLQWEIKPVSPMASPGAVPFTPAAQATVH